MNINCKPEFRQCLRKKFYETKAAAQAEADRLRSDDAAGGVATLTVTLHSYKCPFCIGYHIGRTKR